MRKQLVTLVSILAMQACATGDGGVAGNATPEKGVAPTGASPTGQRVGFVLAHGLSGSRVMNAALVGAGAAAIGFNLATGLRLGYHNMRRVGSSLVAGAIVIGIGILRIPLLEVLLVMLPVSLVVTLAERAR